MRLSLPESLLRQLRRSPMATQAPSPLGEYGEAFLLDLGLGPICYLTAAGQVVIDFSDWDDRPGLRVADEDDTVRYLVVGARKTGINDLVLLLPPRPPDGSVCPRCQGGRWCTLPTQPPAEIVCISCSGRGWLPNVQNGNGRD